MKTGQHTRYAFMPATKPILGAKTVIVLFIAACLCAVFPW